MGREIIIDSWVDSKNADIPIDKLKWVSNILIKNQRKYGLTFNYMYELNSDQIKESLHLLVNSGNGQYVKDIKAAWSREKYRHKNKNNSFALSKEAHRNLRSLANEKRSSIKSTIEELISGTYLKLREDKNKEIREKKQQQKIQGFRFGTPLQQEKVFKKEISDLKVKIKSKQEENDILIMELFEYQVFLEDVIIKDKLDKAPLKFKLTDSQKAVAKKYYDDRSKD